MFLPQYHSEHAACCDLIANLPPDVTGQRIATILPNRCVMIDCGFSMAMPPGYKAEIQARSGHAKAMLIIPNGPAQIDQDFRGRVKVLIANIGKAVMVINHGERFAQMSVSPYWRFQWDEYNGPWDDTARSEGGFGSTGR